MKVKIKPFCLNRLFVCNRAQVSLELIILFAAFFGMLALILPVMSSSLGALIESSDASLARRISIEIADASSLMGFLAEGSVKEFDYYPAKSISVYSSGSQVVFESASKKFFAETGFSQSIPKEDFSSKFIITVLRLAQGVRVEVERVSDS
ncbi:MAG: hypothetical protein NTY48_03625 [Candidatus Diapherotrites archaeon]|nr:hypothetical protein [Candidatus Diapherotrites archaeon]